MAATMLGKERTQKYDIPLSHLEYSFIRECKDSKELEKIVKVLRSGEEGKYPELEAFAENRLEEVNPKSKVLRKEKPISKPRDIEQSEWEKIAGDLENWTSEMRTAEQDLRGSHDSGVTSDERLPPVRGQAKTIPIPKKHVPEGKKETKEKSPGSATKKNKRVKPREYREWDKFDVDAELAKVDPEDEKAALAEEFSEPMTNEPESKVKNVLRKASKPPIPEVVDAAGLTEKEKATKATSEKEKGNEAFRANDFEEALLYYNRSLSLAPTVAAYNNRAQAYLKLKEWDKALSDCQTVLEKDPSNLKGVLRRAVAYQGKQLYTNAKNDLQKVLSAEPTNKRAQDILAEVEKALKEQKTKGRRMVIQESDGSDSESEGEEPMPKNDGKAMVNGVHEKPQQKQKPTEQTKKVENTTKSDQKQENAQKAKSKGIWEEDEVKDEKEVKATEENKTNLSTTSPNTQTKPSEQQTGKDSGKESKTEASPKETKSGKANKRKKKGKGRNQPSPQAPKTETQSAKKNEDQSLPAEKVPDVPVVASADKSVLEAPSETQKGSQVEEVVEKSLPPVQEAPQPPPQKPLPPDVVKYKTAGNDLFKVGQYGEAISHYGKGIDVLKKDELGHAANLAVLYSNQAACKLKVGDCEGCVRDCNSALNLSPGGIKPLTRRAQAFEMMEKYRRAYVDFRQVLYLDQSVDVAMQGVNRCMKVLQETDGPRWREKLPAVSMANLPSYTAPLTAVSPVSTPNDAPPTHPPQAPPPKTQATPPKTQAPPPAPTLTKEELFDKHKSEGNEFVQKGDYLQAVACYSECIETLPDRSVAFTNRALCNLRLNKPENVVTDCNQALVLEPGNIKALFRRAQAYKMLEKYDESFHDLTTLLKKDSKNASARREFQVVINYREQAKKAKLAAEKEKEKEKQNAASAKPRQRLKIQELSDSSDSEEDEPPKAKNITTKTEEKPSNKSKAQKKANKPEAKPAKSEPKPATSEPKPAKSEPKPAKSEPKPAKSEPKPAKSEPKPAKSEEQSPELDAKPESKPAKGDAKSAKSDAKSKKPSKTEKGSSNEKPADQKPGSPKTESSGPTLVNKTPYEFLQAWTSLRSSKDPAPYAKLLEQIEPEELPKVVSNKLDGDMLHMIIRCVELFLDKGINQGAPLPSLFSRSLAYLQHLTSVPRFSMITMFMGDKEKKDLERVLQKLSEGASCQYLQDDLTKLRKTYEL